MPTRDVVRGCLLVLYYWDPLSCLYTLISGVEGGEAMIRGNICEMAVFCLPIGL